MYDLQTDAAFACFDPNIINNNNNNINNNIDNSNNNNFNNSDNNNNISLQQIDSNSMALDFQNPSIEYNDWTVTNNNNNNNRDTVSHKMGYTQFDETTLHQTTATTDLLTLLHLPRCTFASSSTSSPPPPPPPGLAAFLGEMKPSIHMNMMHHEGIPPPPPPPPGSYDPLFHLNLPPQPSPLLRDLMFHGYPANSGVPLRGGGTNNTNNCPSSLFAQMDDPEGGGTNINPMNMNMSFNGIPGMYAENGGDQQHMMMMSSENGVFEFTSGASLDNDGNLVKSPKGFVTEKQRRQNFNTKYDLLKKLIPTPTKADRASIVHDAIAYINELKRTVSDLKLLVQKKRISNDRVKRLKTEENNPSDDPENKSSHGPDGPVGVVKPDPDDALVGQLRSSWLQRKCKDTEIDVRIVDDEVTIKLVQRKKMNCLLSVSRTLDDLQLDLRHVAGGHVGDYYSYLFNSKICEGSSVYASAIANKLIDVVERQYAAASVAVAPTTSF